MTKGYKLHSKKDNRSFFGRFRSKRIMVLWRQWTQSLDKSITLDNQKLSPYQEKAIRLWRLSIKDDNTKLAYNTLGIRQIEKGNLFITYTPVGNSNYIMTIMDIDTNKKSLFEIHVPSKHTQSVEDVFDDEMAKRMRKVENKKRSIIENDIDKLIEEEENNLISKQTKKLVN